MPKKERIERENRLEKKIDEFTEKLVTINRVSKTVKGGRIFKFAALMVVGDGKGKVGVGIGKSGEIPDAVRKGIEDAKKNVVSVNLKDNTIPHASLGRFSAARVLLKPASPGTGILAGGPMRAVLEAVGIEDVRAKSLRSNNPGNVVKATIEGLKLLGDASEISKIRGKMPYEISN